VRARSGEAGPGASRSGGQRPARIALGKVEEALRRTQAEFEDINAQLDARRDALDDRVIANLVAGYAFVDAAVAHGVDLFAMGNLRHLLELNTIVLCGVNRDRRAAYVSHALATEHRFYEERDGGIRDVVEWLATHVDESPWIRAAGAYVRILTKPQLFIEGNHRTGALIMSYILVRDGQPPFVLTPENALAYFDPSSTLKDTPKNGAARLFRLPGIRQQLAALLREQSDARFLAA
jgi:hypothetical protein